jgi:hypothetical protein
MTKQAPRLRSITPRKDQRKRKRGLTPAVRVAIDAMIFERCSRAEACQRAGFSERAFYMALEKPEVAAYWNQQIEMLRTGERARNIQRLAEIRDQDENRNAAVAAVKQLEGPQDEAAARLAAGVPSLGMTIQIISPQPASPVTIDARRMPAPYSRSLPEPDPEPPPRPIFRP